MSLLGKIADIGRSILSSPIVKTVAPALGPVGAAIGAASTAYGVYTATKAAVGGVGGGIMPGVGVNALPPSMALGMMPSLPAIGTAARTAGTVVMAGARRVGTAATNLCRKYPTWCSTIGGTAAVEALMHSGQLPMPKRRRGRGITATELRNFKRVARFTSKYCAPVHRAMRAPAMRRKSCR